jgi:hypothetical protein
MMNLDHKLCTVNAFKRVESFTIRVLFQYIPSKLESNEIVLFFITYTILFFFLCFTMYLPLYSLLFLTAFRSFSCLHLRVSMVAWVGIECVRQISHCMEWPSEHFNMWRVHDGSTLDYFSFPCVSTLVPHPSLSFGWGSGMCGMCWNVMWYERDISCVLNHSIVLD